MGGPAPKLDDPHLRDKIFTLIRSGDGVYQALEACNVSVPTYRRYIKNNPSFGEEIEAALDASVEPVLKMLRKEAMLGDITAAKEWLKHVAPPARGEKKKIEVEHTYQIDPATIETIGDLQERLKGRSAPALPAADDDVIEGEVIEDD